MFAVLVTKVAELCSIPVSASSRSCGMGTSAVHHWNGLTNVMTEKAEIAAKS
jgi:hypothetical protein